jgi:drug/metabolite transporter (DMT)-like permease
MSSLFIKSQNSSPSSSSDTFVFNEYSKLFLYFSSIQELPAQSVALCSYIDPASALIFAAVLLGDVLSPIQWVGAIMILGGAAVGELFGVKKKAS